MTISPRHVIDLSEVVSRDLAGQIPAPLRKVKIRQFSQANGTWAALVGMRSIGSIIVVGTADGSHASHGFNFGAFSFGGGVRNLAVDLKGRIHVLSKTQERDVWTNVVSILDQQGRVLDTYRLPDELPDFDPLLTESGSSILLGGNRSGYFSIGVLTETVTFYQEDGTAVSSYSAPLSAAYQTVGATVEKPAPGEEVSRVLWASSTRTGLLYICLSGLPGSGPADIAVFKVSDGSLQKEIRAELPRSDEAIAGNNRIDTMLPAMGAAGDPLFIADPIGGIIAVY